MKRILPFLLLLATISLQAQQIEFVSQDNESITLRCQLTDFELTTVNTPQGEAVQVSIQDGTPLLKAGAPEVPKLTASYILKHFQSGKVKIINSEYTDYEDILLAPSKGNLYRDVNPSNIPYEFGPVYEQDVFFPRELVKKQAPYVFRDYRGQTAQFFPVQYNPVQQVLRIYDEIVVSIELEEDASLLAAENVRASRNIPEPYHLLYEKRFLNYQDESRYDPVGELGSMLIITTETYTPQIEDMVRWKNQKGIPTEVVLMSEIGESPEAVLSFINEYYQNNGLTYLLIIGDENDVPTQQTAQQNACDHCYAQQEGNDHYPEFFVGRLNAENPEQLQVMLDRNMLYELNPGMDNPDWFSTALGFGSSEGPGDDDEYDYEHLNNIKSSLLDYGFSHVYEFYDGSQASSSPTPGDPTADAGGNPNAAMINEVINNGATLMNYTGHGDHGILVSGSFNNTAINQLTNNGAYPFLIAVACCVGDFQNDFGSGPCLGDTWIRATDDATGLPSGGIGGCFSSILQSWAPPMEGQDEMNALIVEAGTYDIRHTMGGIVIHGGGAMIDAYGGGGDEMMDTWNIFGDPSIALWTRTPEALVADHVEATFIGATQLEVSCNVEGALVGLYYEGKNIAYGVVEGGFANLDFEALEFPSPLTVTVTAYNHLPYQGDVQVTPLEGPYVILSEYEIDDTNGGNANLVVDYSETIDLNVTMSNVGLDTARAVQTTINTDVEEITLINDTFVWGDIANEEEMSQDAAFSFSVADYIVDQMAVPFQLTTIDENDNTWTRNISVIINAPVLELGAITVDDAITGNGNGRLDPGESVNIIIENLNVGHSDSPEALAVLSTTNPYIEIVGNNQSVGIISDNSSAVYTVNVAQDIPIATVIEMEYQLTAGPYGLNALPVLSANLLIEEFETDNLETDIYGWNNNEGHPWFLTDFEPYAGAQCLQSADIENSQISSVKMDINILEDGQMTFSRRVSSESGWDFLYFYMDGEQLGEWSGEEAWEEVTFDVPAGEHGFVWTYFKDQYISDGMDAAWIDDIILPPFETLDTTTINSIEELGFTDIRLAIAPNPVKETAIINYELGQAQTASLFLINNQGIVLNTLTAPAEHLRAIHQVKLEMDTYPAGLYYVLLRTENGTKVARLVKE